MSMLRLEAVRKEFGRLVAVDDVSVSVEQGTITGLIGPNGSGKTTLFNLITGFIQPTRGRIEWEGENITNWSPHRVVSRGLARTFQITSLLKEMTVLENVVMAHHLHIGAGLLEQFLRRAKMRAREKAMEEKAMAILERMGILHVKDEIAGELPIGLQRSLGIAIALATEPKMVLLDEPVAGMNPVEKTDIMERIKRLNRDGMTVLLVEHDMKAVMGAAQRIAVLNFGRKIAEGSPEEISRNKDVIEAYLGAEDNSC